MRFAEYVVTGWVLTGAVIAGYWLHLTLRIRRATKALDRT